MSIDPLVENVTGNPGSYQLTHAARWFKNIESYPGQLFLTPDLVSAKREVQLGRRDAVKAGRQAQRMNSAIRGSVDTKADMVVGPRLFVQPTPEWDIIPGFTPAQQKAFVDQCAAWFRNWAFDTGFVADASRHNDFGILMRLAYRGVCGPDAECLGIIHFDEDRMISQGHIWATTVELVNPDQLKTPPILSGVESSLDAIAISDVSKIFEGKELDKYGAWTKLWILKKHPSEGGNALEDFVPVPRQDPVSGRPLAFHYFAKTSPEAQRGITSLVTIFRAADQLDQFDNATLGAAVLNAVYSIYAESAGDPETIAEQLAPAGGGGISAFEQKLGFYKDARIRVGGNRIAVLPPGDKLVMTAVDRAAMDPQPFVNAHLRKIANAQGISFEQVSKNFSEANYSSARAAILDVWRGVISERLAFANAVPSQIYGCVIEEAVARGRIFIPSTAPSFQEMRSAYTRCEWTGPAMPEVDPYKAAQAMEIRLRTRVTNHQRECANMGYFYFDTFKQIGVEFKEAHDLGFELEPAVPGVAATAPDTAAGGSQTQGDRAEPGSGADKPVRGE